MVYLYAGVYGAGKSSYLAKIGNDCAFNFERIRCARSWLKSFYEENDVDFGVPNHFVYSTDKMFFRREGYYKRESHDFDPFKFGIQELATEGVECAFQPKFSDIIIDEGHKFYPSDTEIPLYMKSAVNMQRHIEANMHIASPRFMNIHKEFRVNAYGCYMKGKTVDITEDKIYIKWYYDLIEPGDIDAYCNASIRDRKKFCHHMVDVEKKANVFKIYDNHCHDQEFYKGLSKSRLKIV